MPVGIPYGPQSTNNAPNSRPQNRPKPQPTDKPRTKREIPGHEDWYLIETKLQRRFVYNSKKNESYWRIPEKLKKPILEMDQARIREKAEKWAREQEEAAGKAPGAAERPGTEREGQEEEKEELDSEYEEVEVTDDEDAEQEAKRQRMEMEGEAQQEQPIEFTEEDIAFQLAALGQEYGLDPEEYGDGDPEAWDEGDEGMKFTEEDAAALFKDLLNDSGISPYKPWDVVVEEGKLVEDGRYTALTTMKRRKEVWDEWTAETIAKIREQRAKEEKKDPRIPFLAFLEKNATPKLYWPEFRRKFRKEDEMRRPELSDKEREKMYREHTNRLKMPASTLKTDFLNLLKAQPPSLLNNRTQVSNLPPQLLGDIKYISLPASTRDKLVEDYISTLPPPPSSDEAQQEESEEAKKQKADRERREKALADRERRVAEEKRRQQKSLAFGKGRMREEEEEIERAMNVGKGGLKGQLMEMDVDKADDK